MQHLSNDKTCTWLQTCRGLGAIGVTKASALSIGTGHMGLHAPKYDVIPVERWLHHREAEMRCHGAYMNWWTPQ
jgi:hypothetical protein